jgi:hypothetical protein
MRCTAHKLPHLLRDWAHRPATSAPELGPEQVGPVHVLHDSDAPGDRGSTLRLGYLTGPVMDQRHDSDAPSMVSADLVRLGIFALSLSARAHTDPYTRARVHTHTHSHSHSHTHTRTHTHTGELQQPTVARRVGGLGRRGTWRGMCGCVRVRVCVCVRVPACLRARVCVCMRARVSSCTPTYMRAITAHVAFVEPLRATTFLDRTSLDYTLYRPLPSPRAQVWRLERDLSIAIRALDDAHDSAMPSPARPSPPKPLRSHPPSHAIAAAPPADPSASPTARGAGGSGAGRSGSRSGSRSPRAPDSDADPRGHAAPPRRGRARSHEGGGDAAAAAAAAWEPKGRQRLQRRVVDPPTATPTGARDAATLGSARYMALSTYL